MLGGGVGVDSYVGGDWEPSLSVLLLRSRSGYLNLSFLDNTLLIKHNHFDSIVKSEC